MGDSIRAMGVCASDPDEPKPETDTSGAAAAAAKAKAAADLKAKEESDAKAVADAKAKADADAKAKAEADAPGMVTGRPALTKEEKARAAEEYHRMAMEAQKADMQSNEEIDGISDVQPLKPAAPPQQLASPGNGVTLVAARGDVPSHPLSQPSTGPAGDAPSELKFSVKIGGTEVDTAALALAVGQFLGGAGAADGDPQKSLLTKNPAVWVPVRISPSLLNKKSKLDATKLADLKGKTLAGHEIQDVRGEGETSQPPSPAITPAAAPNELKFRVNVEGTEVDVTSLALAVGQFCGGAGAANGDAKDSWVPIRVTPSLLNKSLKLNAGKVAELKGQTLAGVEIKDVEQ